LRRAANPIPENDVAKQQKSPAPKTPAVPGKPVKPAKLVGNTITCPKSQTPPQLCMTATLHVCGTYEATIKEVTVEIRNQGDTAAVPNGGIRIAVMAAGKWGTVFNNLPVTVGAAAFHRVKVCWNEAGGVLAKQDTVKIRVDPKGTDCAAACAATGGRKGAASRAAAR